MSDIQTFYRVSVTFESYTIGDLRSLTPRRVTSCGKKHVEVVTPPVSLGKEKQKFQSFHATEVPSPLPVPHSFILRPLLTPEGHYKTIHFSFVLDFIVT